MEERRLADRVSRAVLVRRALALVVVAALGTACGGGPDRVTLPSPRRVLGADHYRPLDGLLRSEALRRVVDMQIDKDTDGLVAALASEYPHVRARAAFALASVQDTLAVPTLIERLPDPDSLVRADVAFALGQTPTPAGAQALLARLLIETDSMVLAELLDALGRAGGEAELRALREAELVDARDGEPRIAVPLALAYGRFALRGLHDQAAAEWVGAALMHYDQSVRLNAAYYFARSRDPQSWAQRQEELVEALAAYGRGDRAAMHLLVALGRLDDADHIPVLLDWLATTPDWAIRVSALRALAQHGESAAARRALIRSLRDPSWHVRVAAATGLPQTQPDAAEADSLLALLPDFEHEPPVFGALLRAIATAGATQETLDRWLALDDVRLRRAAVGALSLVPGRAAFDAMAAAAHDRDSTLASAAVEALGQRRLRDFEDASDESYFEVFATALRTRDLAVSSSAATALADSVFEPHGAGPLIQSVLLQMQPPDDTEAMVEMVRALGALRDRTAVPLLRELRGGRTPELRVAAAQSLARIADEPAGVPSGEPASTPLMQWDWLAQWGHAPRLSLETERGTIVLELSVEQAPQTAQTLLSLAAEGRYDGVPFHRVVPNFVIQGGDVGRGDGWGGPGFVIRSEFTRIPFLRGTGGIASSGKDTEGSQYFVTHSMQPHLDGRYTAFGTLLDGIEVLDEIREGDVVIRATAVPTPR